MKVCLVLGFKNTELSIPTLLFSNSNKKQIGQIYWFSPFQEVQKILSL